LSYTPNADAQIASGLISSWGKACKIGIVEQFDVPKSNAVVNIGATEKQSIDDRTTSTADIKKRGLFLIKKWGSRSLKDQASFESSVSFACKIIDGVSHRCSGLLNLVFESTGSIHQMGLDLLCFTLSFHAVVAGDISGSSLKPSFGVFGGGLDLVFETHRFWARG
jgi:hypothetical protein